MRRAGHIARPESGAHRRGVIRLLRARLGIAVQKRGQAETRLAFLDGNVAGRRLGRVFGPFGQLAPGRETVGSAAFIGGRPRRPDPLGPAPPAPSHRPRGGAPPLGAPPPAPRQEGGGGGKREGGREDHALAWVILAAFTVWLAHDLVIAWITKNGTGGNDGPGSRRRKR